ncbi:MAG: hypothetical protein DRI54_02190 [Bacteroidetes bacterium]|nr:MAG: hypothetical protein DRI54_02190 [Bacteroidota bacterium]
MKKLITIVFVSMISIFGFSQSWSPTNISSFDFTAIASIESHNNELYGITIIGVSRDLFKMNNDNSSWSQINTSEIGGLPSYVESAGNRLYVGALGDSYNGMLYYSTDNGATFITDTAGLPEYLGAIPLIYGLQYFNGKVLLNLGSSGYWIKDTSITDWHKIDTPTSLNGGTDPICYLNNTLYVFDHAGAFELYSSVDYGTNWSVVNTNLPETFIVVELVSDVVTDRLYIAGGNTDGTAYGLYYSDDNGINWTYDGLSGFLDTDINGTQQEIRGVYSDGNALFIALENNEANSVVKIISSTSGVQNLAFDTLGLLYDPLGTYYGHTFVKHNENIAVALSNRDVYLKELVVTDLDEKSLGNKFKLYPVPAKGVLNISGLENNTGTIRLQIVNLNGQSVLNINNLKSNKVNTESIPKGSYIVLIYNSVNDLIHRQKIIKL